MSLSIVLTGKSATRRVDLATTEAIRVGRSPSCDIVVDDLTVSEFHAEIRMESERLVLRDLKSTNGTFVNGVRTVFKALSPGDQIRFGSVEFEVALQGGVLANGSRPAPLPGSPTVVSGVVEDLTVLDLVQVLAATGKTGTLMLFSNRFGRIDFKDGTVCFAKLESLSGEKAFHRLVGWGRAEFQFSKVPPVRGNIRLPTPNLLVEAAKQQEQMQELWKRLPAQNVELSLDRSAAPPSLSPIEADVVERLGKLKTLSRVMDACPHSDVEIARAMSRLMDIGLLRSPGANPDAQ